MARGLEISQGVGARGPAVPARCRDGSGRAPSRRGRRDERRAVRRGDDGRARNAWKQRHEGLLRNEAGTEEAFKGGWFHSGDLGVRQSDGYVRLMDRAKDVVISGGENISTVEVEQALISHQAVAEAAVIGVPDEKWGERPKAFVVLTQGQDTTEEAIIDHVRSRIAHYKAPKEVVFMDELPTNSTARS